LITTKPIYFGSDFHLGTPNQAASLEREKRIVAWLDEVLEKGSELFLLGDVFDFWFEYKKAIPRGYVRLLGKLAEIADKGIPVHFFTGNHDMWTFGYLEQEIGLTLYRKPITIERQGKTLHIGHGDGLGPGDRSYKFLKNFFDSKLCQWMFARLHPNFSFGMAEWFSKGSRTSSQEEDKKFLGEKEWLAIYCKDFLETQAVDYFIFGHRHLPIEMELTKNSKYINIGEWLNYNSYGIMENGKLQLKYFRA
jgi:UDP-2,3-diacylglucosamine hydrolase